MTEPRTADYLLSKLKQLREGGRKISKDVWLEAAFDLNLFRLDEAEKLHALQQQVARKRLEIMRVQEKRNVAAAEAEIAATDEYRAVCDQALKLDVILEFVRIAKKQADLDY